MRLPPLSKAFQFTGGDIRDLGSAILLVPAFHVAVRIAGFARTAARIERRSGVLGPSDDAISVERCRLAINRVKQYSPIRGNCLSQSMALAWMLRGRGVQPNLRLGARLTESKFEAHAWVEWRGRVLNDSQDVHSRFTPLSAKPG